MELAARRGIVSLTRVKLQDDAEDASSEVCTKMLTRHVEIAVVITRALQICVRCRWLLAKHGGSRNGSVSVILREADKVQYEFCAASPGKASKYRLHVVIRLL